MKAKRIEISHRTILFTIFVLISLWFLWFIRDILLQLFVALLIMTILNPFVTKFQKFGVPRAASILLVYLASISLIVLAVAGIIPPLVEESSQLVNRLPFFLDNVGWSTEIGERVANEVISEIGRLPSQVARATISVFSNVFDVVTTLIFAFYLLLSRDSIEKQMDSIFGSENHKKIHRVINLLEERLGGWVRGQLALMFLVGTTTYIGLFLLGIPFALPLAILAGILEIVPYIGPVISAIPVVIIGLGISPLMGLSAFALAFIVQQMENYLFVPKVMQRTVGISPIVTLIALAIGFRLAGIVGVLISVPVVITVHILSKEYYSSLVSSK